MKKKMRPAPRQAHILLGKMSFLALPLLAFLIPACVKAAPITPAASDAFVEAVGINTHLSYTDTPYAQNWDHADPTQNVQKLFTALGIRHVRDRIPHPQLQPEITYARPRLARLYQDFGVRFITGPDTKTNNILDPSKMAPYLNEYANGTIALDGKTIYVREILEALEGPNEYDNHNNQAIRDPNWVVNLKNYQLQLYRAIKGNSLLAKLPVVMPSLVYTQYCTDVLGSLTDRIDVGNLHSYPNYPYFHKPSQNLGWHFDSGKNCYGSKPVYVTETGYQSGTSGISDRTIAKYTSRLLAEYFVNPPIKRTYLYQLIDTLPTPGSLWGLIRPEKTGQKVNGFDQFKLTPKPSYYAVKSLLDLLRESMWVKAQKQWVVPTVNLKPVDITLTGKLASTHHLLLQKSTGDYFLLLWQEVESFNPTAGNFEPANDDVTIALPTGYQLKALHKYDSQFKFTTTSLTNSGNKVTVQVPDSVMAVQFSISTTQTTQSTTQPAAATTQSAPAQQQTTTTTPTLTQPTPASAPAPWGQTQPTGSTPWNQ